MMAQSWKANEWRQANRDSGNGSSSKRLACSTKVGVGDAGKDGVLSFQQEGKVAESAASWTD